MPEPQTTDDHDEESDIILRESDIVTMRERLAALNAECNQRHAEIRMLTQKIKAAEFLLGCAR